MGKVAFLLANKDRQWRIIKEYEGRYSVSNCGEVRNNETGKILTPQKNEKGYLFLILSKRPTKKGLTIKNKHFIHRLVAEAFMPEFRRDYDIHHIDLQRTQNSLDNLLLISKSDHIKLHAEIRKKIA